MFRQAVRRLLGTLRARPKTFVSIFLVCFLSLVFIASGRRPRVFVTRHLLFSSNADKIPDYPPPYEELREWERSLPQHNLDLMYPEGKTGRYIHFKSQIALLGWNNCLNELLMNSYLAYKSKRTYVFKDYVWKPEYYPWPQYKYRTWPPRTPLNALISGPTAGGPWEDGDGAPRSISEEWFDIVCPEKERRIINTREIKPDIYWDDGKKIFATWEKLLLEAPERCIEIQSAQRSEDTVPQVFDLFLWGSDRILPLWEEFRDSPISQLLRTSPIVNAVIARNEYLFLPRVRGSPVLENPYDRMLAIHIRRGDFKEACLGLATWNSTFYSWNLLPFLPDRFVPPPGGEWGKNTPENIEFYMKRCLSSPADIVQKIRNSRADYLRGDNTKVLDTLYILTNADSTWLQQFKAEMQGDGWSTIVTSKDLVLNAEGKDVSMAVDMDIARRAAVFIGNGWSSFTSNVVHRRLVDKKDPLSNRFY